MLKSFAPIQVACLALGLSFLSTALAHGAVVDFASPHATYTTGTGPRSVAIGTLNADTRPDMVVCNGTSNSISVFLQDAVTVGAFGAKTDFATLSNPASVAIVDLNGDGKGDIVVACQASPGGFCVFLGNGNGTFPTRVDYLTTNFPQAMRVADVDGDNKLDVLGGGSPDIAFLKGVGDGTFLAPTYITTGSSVSSVAVGDLNGDNKLDIAVASSPFVQILFGNGDGSFAAPVSYSNGLYVLSIGVGNFTADSLPDVVVSNYNDSSLSIFPNQGGGVFGPHQEFATGLSPKSLQPVDLDGDGNLDVVMVDVGLAAVGYLRGKGDGTFYPHIAYTTGSGPYVDAVGDLTGDGKPDVVAANQNAASVSVLIQGTGVAPATISTLATTQVADRSVTLTWTAPVIESFEATAYDVRYSTSPITAGNFAAATQASGEPSPFIAGSLVTFAVEGLSPSTLYYFAEQTRDAFGRSSGVSNVVSAMTTTAGGSGNSSSNSSGCGVGSGLATLWLLTLGTLIALRASGSRSQLFI